MQLSAKSLADVLIEGPIVPSFTKIGAAARRRLFDWEPLESLSLDGKTVVITGATSGLGEAAAHTLARLGAHLVIVARSPEKTAKTVREIQARSGSEKVTSVLADLGKPEDVLRAAEELAAAHPQIHALIHNAGALFPDRKRTANGTDLAVEVMVAARFLLTNKLLPLLRAAGPGRVITMSSGGMYSQPLSVANLEMPDEKYSGAQQYGRAKRAQVSLNEVWAEKVSQSEVVFHAMHPGWAATPGVTESLPAFDRFMRPLLRSAEDGADTMIWLAAADEPLKSSGKFWHDRATRSTHKIPRTSSSDTAERRQRLWEWCEEHTGITFAD